MTSNEFRGPWRVTIVNNGVKLFGQIDDSDMLVALAGLVQPIGLVIVSSPIPADSVGDDASELK